MTPHTRVILPCLVTAFGFAAGCAALVEMPALTCVPWLATSVALDVCDGVIARALGGVSEFGAKLDWTVDSALSYLIAYRCLSAYPTLAVAVCSVVMLTQAFASYWGVRFSGRTAVTALTIAWLYYPSPT